MSAPAKKVAPFADDHHRLDLLIRIGLFNAANQPLAHRVAQRVHRWVVGGNNEDVAVAAGADGRGHGWSFADNVVKPSLISTKRKGRGRGAQIAVRP
jgi:hypothetical protein